MATFPVQILVPSGTALPALTVEVADSGVPPVTYAQVKQSLGSQVYKVNELYLYSTNINQLLGVIQYQIFDSDGNQKYSSIATTIDPYAGNAVAITIDLKPYEQKFILNGNSSFSATILPFTYVQVKFWAVRLTNEFGRNLDNFIQIQKDANRPYFFNNYGALMQDIKATNAEIEKTAKLNLTENIFESSPPIAIFQKDKQPIIVAPKEEDSKKVFILGILAAVVGGYLIGDGKE